MQDSFIKKYTPINLDDMLYNDDFKHIVSGFIDMDYLNILFVGHQGCGKTTLIRCILNKYYNCNAYTHNVLALNGLNDLGINNFRQNIITFCQTASEINRKKKTILLDDIEQINEQSQQIIRSCIDKYSHNVNFVASCIDTNKVIDSIQSRLNILKVNAINTCNMEHIMNNVITQEHLGIDMKSQQFLISISDNSIKILLNNLEKLKLLNEPVIDYQKVKLVCSHICFKNFKRYTHEWYSNKNIHGSLIEIMKLFHAGYSLVDILENYFLYVKQSDDIDSQVKFYILPFICKYITIFQTIHENEIELYLFTCDLMNNVKLDV